MQIVHYGDLIKSVTSNAIIVHGANAQGVMGRGFALQVKKTYPEAFEAYRNKYRTKGLFLGDVIYAAIRDDLIIVNAITQKDYWTPGASKDHVYADYDAIKQCFLEISRLSYITDLPIHYPLIGAGLANGNWDRINKIICDTLEGIEHHLWIYR